MSSSCAVLEETNFSFAEADIKAISPHKTKKYQSDKFDIKSGSQVERNSEPVTNIYEFQGKTKSSKLAMSHATENTLAGKKHINKAHAAFVPPPGNEKISHDERLQQIQQSNDNYERKKYMKSQSAGMEAKNRTVEVRKKTVTNRKSVSSRQVNEQNTKQGQNGLSAETTSRNTKPTNCKETMEEDVKKRNTQPSGDINSTKKITVAKNTNDWENKTNNHSAQIPKEMSTKGNSQKTMINGIAEIRKNQKKNYEEEILRLQYKMAKLQAKISQMQAKVIRLQNGTA